MAIRIYGEHFLRYILKIFDFFVKMMYDCDCECNIKDAEVSELADEQDSGSCERYAREGSSPFFRIEYPGARGCRDFLYRRLDIFKRSCYDKAS